jgi:hypothetical protein
MYLKKILHPELILNRRGSPQFRKLYQNFLLQFTVNKNNKVLTTTELVSNYNPIVLTHLLVCKEFQHQMPTVFYTTQDFIDAVGMIDKKIPLDMLPDDFFGYFAFPDNSVTDHDGQIVHGAYVQVGLSQNINCQVPFGKKALVISYHCSPNGLDGSLGKIVTELKEEFISKLLAQISYEQFLNAGNAKVVGLPVPDVSQREKFCRLIVNLVLYVTAKNSAIQVLKPMGNANLSNRQVRRIKKENGGKINLCTLPVQLVNFDYSSRRQYHVDGTLVHGHLRWQRSGKGFKEHKLIWIAEHERKYRAS